MAIHRNNFFFACSNSSRCDRVVSSVYRGDLAIDSLPTIDYEEEIDDIWFITSSRGDRTGYMMSTLLNHFQCFQSLRFLEQLFGVESEYNQNYKEYCRLLKFDVASKLEVIEDISLFFNAVLSTDLSVFEQMEGYAIDANDIENMVVSVIGRDVCENDLDSDCDRLEDLFVMLKLIQQLFQKSVKNGMCVSYMSNSAG